jgi:RNA polymerase sigma-70 factor (ECF subfamily)
VSEEHGLSQGKAFLDQFLKAERRIFAYIFTILPHRADAEDVLQEVSKMMWEKFDAQMPPRDFVAWGCRIAHFRVQEHRRSRRRQRVIFSDELLEQLAETASMQASALRLDERHEALSFCLGKLGQRDRALLAERLKDGATARSTAETIGLSIDSVYKALARIREALHHCIARSLAAEGRP